MTDALREAAQAALRIFDWLERRAIYGDAEMAAVHAKLRTALAAPTAAPPVPAGMAMVPVEPTQGMLRAGFDATGHTRSGTIYRAMLAAAPQQAPTPHAGEKL